MYSSIGLVFCCFEFKIWNVYFPQAFEAIASSSGGKRVNHDYMELYYQGSLIMNNDETNNPYTMIMRMKIVIIGNDGG